MPYKDPEKQKEANLKAQRKRRGLIPVPYPVIPDGGDSPVGVTFVIPDTDPVTPSEADVTLPPEWAHVRDFIRSESSGMPKLERLQRIAGSLGKYAEGVYFGDLTMGEIGKVIGVLPPLVTTPRL